MHGGDHPLLHHLRAAVGPNHVLSEPDLRSSYEQDCTGRFGGPCLAVVRPAGVEEVVEVVRRCGAAGVPIIPQGGNTGLVGGGVPPGSDQTAAVILSSTRLTRLDPVDVAASQVTAGAGITLSRLQGAAAASGLAFPVDLAARESATVGGMVATNAGGLRVLRYGSMRAQVIGLEAVLAGGQVLRRLDGLVKDNTGYDLSQLLVGSEGTLAVITAARLRLVPDLPERVVALLGLGGTAEALRVLQVLRSRAEGLEAAEIFYQDGLELVCRHARMAPPLAASWPAYLVVECAGHRDPSDALFGALIELDLPGSATAIATDAGGRTRLWAYRERHTEAVSSIGIPHKLDVTLPLDRLPGFEEDVRAVVASTAPGATLVLWGHIGDGNLHVNVVGPPDDDGVVDEAILRLVASHAGSISAEHGVGRAKVPWLSLSRPPADLEAMVAIKQGLDPGALLNPGVIFAR